MASWRKLCIDKQKHSGIDYISKALVATIMGDRLGAVEKNTLKRLQVTMDWAMYWFYCSAAFLFVYYPLVLTTIKPE